MKLRPNGTVSVSLHRPRCLLTSGGGGLYGFIGGNAGNLFTTEHAEITEDFLKRSNPPRSMDRNLPWMFDPLFRDRAAVLIFPSVFSVISVVIGFLL